MKSPVIKIYVEVPETVHRDVRVKALQAGMSVTQYLLKLIAEHREAAVGRGPFPPARHQKRLVLDLSRDAANELRSLSRPFGSFRTMLIACLEQSGISFPLDLELFQAAEALGRLIARMFGRDFDDKSARAAWRFMATVSGRYRDEDETAYRSFFEVLQRSARHELARTVTDKSS